MPSLTPAHPDAPEPAVAPFDLARVPDEAADRVPATERLPPPDANPADVPGALPLPRIVLGCAPFGQGIYAATGTPADAAALPLRIVRAALRAGITAFDTAPHYHPSEIVLGHALAALRDEFPRNSYSIITKVAKYGPRVANHAYDPHVVRKSLDRSLKRFQTDYLDIVYLHDVEFIADAPFPAPAGQHLEALGGGEGAAAWGLNGERVEARGEGDAKFLACLEVLREYQAAGRIRRVGIAGYSLPVLLRFALLALHATGAPLDVVQGYATQTVQCALLGAGFVDALTERARVRQVVNAAPLAMGLLTSGGGPPWHPARAETQLFAATRDAAARCTAAGTSLEAVAIAFGYRTLRQPNGAVVPCVVGCTDLEQLHQTLQAYHAANSGSEDATVKHAMEDVATLLKDRGVLNYCWQSPSPADMRDPEP